MVPFGKGIYAENSLWFVRKNDFGRRSGGRAEQATPGDWLGVPGGKAGSGNGGTIARKAFLPPANRCLRKEKASLSKKGG